MRRYGSRRRSWSSAPKKRPKQASAAQIRAFDEAPATVTGRFPKGALIRDLSSGAYYRVSTPGFRYHEDAGDRIYGVKPARLKPDEKAAVLLADAMRRVEAKGTWYPRLGGSDSSEPPSPPAEQLGTWKNSRPNSMADFPTLTLSKTQDGRHLLIYFRPVYDDSPIKKWQLVSDKEARALLKAMELAPDQRVQQVIIDTSVKVRKPSAPEPASDPPPKQAAPSTRSTTAEAEALVDRVLSRLSDREQAQAESFRSELVRHAVTLMILRQDGE